MNFTKRSLEILKSFRSKQNIQLVADIFDTTYDIIRNNYFKHFWRVGYLTRIGYGYYIISEKGAEKIKNIETSYKIDSLIIEESKKGATYKEILDIIKEKYNMDFTLFSLYTRVSRARKNNNICDRRKAIFKIPQQFSFELAELIGLIFSDGSINKYKISFYNKDIALLNRFQYLASKVFNIDKQYKREQLPSFFVIDFYSVDIANFLNKLTNHKSLIPTQILNSNKEIKTSFLRGYFSGDGCVVLSIPNKKFYNKFQVDSFLFLACKKIKITKSIENILSSLSYSAIVKAKGLYIHKHHELMKFYNEIGFINSSKIADYSRNWKGFEKNQILKYIACELKQDKKLHSLRYGERELVINHIQNKLKRTFSKKY